MYDHGGKAYMYISTIFMFGACCILFILTSSVTSKHGFSEIIKIVKPRKQ
jgi:hypothetical protein